MYCISPVENSRSCPDLTGKTLKRLQDIENISQDQESLQLTREISNDLTTFGGYQKQLEQLASTDADNLPVRVYAARELNPRS